MTRLAPFGTLAALVLLVTALIVRSGMTPAALPETAPLTEFSSMRAMRHVREIAARPHPSGSAEHARVREHIMAELRGLGLDPQVQEATGVGTRYPAAGHVKNVLVRVPGRTPGGKAVLIAAHYDGVGAAPAAGDDASGSAALLETLRALRAGAPLEHDVIALFTDGEEAGLLGAAAFVREHPWARDVAMTMNFEARGTEGRSLMFETGAGNLDVVRVLQTLDDVSASSLSVTIYRSLPNDTDLSEFSVLGTPALNFAFVDGVERYHTFHDDVAHLSAGSVQHHGNQMLALAKAFGNGPLPRPVTGDAIFFDNPFMGTIAYPESYSVPIAFVVAAAVVAFAVFSTRSSKQSDKTYRRGRLLGAVGMLVSAALSGLVVSQVAAAIEKMHTATRWDGEPSWNGVYALALATLALAITAGVWALARRWASRDALHVGALAVWAGLAGFTAVKLPGTSYLFAWPVLAVALAGIVDMLVRNSLAAHTARWIATMVAAVFIVPVCIVTAGYTLPLAGPGGIAVGVLVPMLAWLLAPHLESMGAERRWRSAGLMLAASLMLVAFGAATVRRDDARPTVENLAYVTSVDADSAWLVAPATQMREGSFALATLGPTARTLPVQAEADSSMQWIQSAMGTTRALAVRGEARTIADGPEMSVVADSVVGDRRRLTLRFTAPSGTLAYRVNGAAYVRAVAINGIALDTARYRSVPRALSIPFTAPPDSGFTAVIEAPVDSAVVLRLAAVTSGLPTMRELRVSARPSEIVAVQGGDVTVRYQQVDITPTSTPGNLHRTPAIH